MINQNNDDFSFCLDNFKLSDIVWKVYKERIRKVDLIMSSVLLEQSLFRRKELYIIDVQPLPSDGKLFFMRADEDNKVADETTTENKPPMDGCTCAKCKQYYPFAEPNQSDGSLICYSCRKNL